MAVVDAGWSVCGLWTGGERGVRGLLLLFGLLSDLERFSRLEERDGSVRERADDFGILRTVLTGVTG